MAFSGAEHLRVHVTMRSSALPGCFKESNHTAPAYGGEFPFGLVPFWKSVPP